MPDEPDVTQSSRAREPDEGAVARNGSSRLADPWELDISPNSTGLKDSAVESRVLGLPPGTLKSPPFSLKLARFVSRFEGSVTTDRARGSRKFREPKPLRLIPLFRPGTDKLSSYVSATQG